MEKQILDYIKRYEHVTFAELSRNIEGFDGKWSMTVPGNSSIVIWHNVSDEAHDSLSNLLKNKKIFSHPSSVMTYMCDGMVLDLDIARSNREYKKTRWCPVCFCTYPQRSNKKKNG